jgi:hypothetical protein
MEDRLRQRWGDQTTAIVHTPAGRLWHVRDTQGASLLWIVLSSAAPAQRIAEQLARFADKHKPLKGAPGLLWPSHTLPDPTLPALRIPLNGPEAAPLPVFLLRADKPWSTRRICGQLIPLLEGLRALHDAGRVHGAVSPLSVAVERLGDEHVLRWINQELWEPLRELGLPCAEVLGAGPGRDASLARPTQVIDVQQLGQLLAWLRAQVVAGCVALSDRRWPAPLDDLLVLCASAAPPPCAQIIQTLQELLADWESLADAVASPPPIPSLLDPRTAAPPGVRVSLPALGDEVSAAHPLAPLDDARSVAVRLPLYVGQSGATSQPSPIETALGDPSSPPISDPDAPRNPPMPASPPPQQPTSPPDAEALGTADSPLPSPPALAKDKDDDEEEPTTMVLSRERLSGLFDGIQAQQAPPPAESADPAEAAAVSAERPPSAPSMPGAAPPPPPPSAPKLPKAPARPRRRKKSTRSDINPENQVISVKHNLGARAGLASQPAVVVLIVLLVIAIVLLVLLLLRSKSATAQPATAPYAVALVTGQAAAGTATSPKLRLALPSRSSAQVDRAAVNPAGDSYATCAGGDVSLWSTRADAAAPLASPSLLDRFDIGDARCAQLRFSASGQALFVVTTGGALLRYDIPAAHLSALNPALPVAARIVDVQPLRGDDLLLHTADDATLAAPARANQRQWRGFAATGEASPLRAHPALRRCESDSPDIAATIEDGALTVLAFTASSARSLPLPLPDQALACAVTANGHRLSVLVAGVGVQHWALGETPTLLGVFPAWPEVQGARVGAQLRYGGRSDSLLLANRDRLLLLDPRMERVIEALSAPLFSTLQGHEATPLPDQRAALIWRDHRVHLLNLSSGVDRGAASHHLPWTHEVSAFSADGVHALSVFAELGDAALDRPGPRTLIGVWDLTRYALVAKLEWPSWVRRLALSPSGDGVAVVTERLDPGVTDDAFDLRVWHLPSLNPTEDAPVALSAIPERVQWSADGLHLLIRTPDRQTRIFRRAGDDSLVEATHASEQLTTADAAAFIPGGGLLIWSPARGLYALDLLSERPSAPLLTSDDLGGRLQVHDIAAHPGSPSVLLTGRGEPVWLTLPTQPSEQLKWRLMSAPARRARVGAQDPWAPLDITDRAVFDRAGRRFALGAAIYDSATAQPLTQLAASPAATTRTRAFSPDGLWLLSESGRWDVGTGAFEAAPAALTREGESMLADDISAAYHVSGQWVLQQAAGFAKLQPTAPVKAQGAELALLGDDAWVIASDQAFHASPEGRSLLQVSDGRAPLDLTQAPQLEGPLALARALSQPEWKAGAPIEPAAPVALSYLVRLSLDTTPGGALVYLDLGDGASPLLLGETPLSEVLPGPSGPATLRISKPGYVNEMMPWSAGEDLTISTELREVLTDLEAASTLLLDGPMQAAEVGVVVQRNRHQLRQCVALVADDPDALPARADARLDILAEGDVRLVEFQPPLASASLTQCLRHVIMGWRFPSKPEGSAVRYSFLLQQYLSPLNP